MKKRSQNTCDTRLVYVHGTNGSGKSTLARALIAASGGILQVERLTQHKKATATVTIGGPVMVGSYATACGGVDGLSPYASIHDVCQRYATEGHLFAEGLITPGVETCSKLAGYVDKHLFIYLDTPVEKCVANVLKRRGRKGTDKPYNPDNLYKKIRSAQGWADRLENAGLNVQRLSWTDAYLECLNFLGIEPSIDYILGTTP